MFQPYTIAIGEYLVTQLKDAFIYEEFFRFVGDTIHPPEKTDEVINDFLDTLEDQGVVGLTVPADQQDPKYRYLTWRDLPIESDHVALQGALSPEDLKPYNGHQLDVLSTGYRLPVFQEAEFDTATYFKWLGDPSVGPLEDKWRLVVRSAMERMDLRHIESHGWAIRGVGMGEVDPPFAYTIGLTAKVGLELMLVGPMNVGTEMLNDIAARLVEGETMEEIAFLHDHRLKGTEDVHLRVGFKVLDMDSHEAQGVAARVPGVEVTKIVQVLYGDKNNTLPTEAGYDETLIQHLIDQ